MSSQLTNIFNDHFKNLVFTHVKNTDGYGVYAAHIHSLLGDGNKYILVVVPFHMCIKPQVKLHELWWVSIQTRTLQNGYKLPKQHFNNPHTNPEISLTVKDRSLEKTTYYCPLPIQIDLLHNIKKKSVYQYEDKESLGRALFSFNCVVTKLDSTAI